MSHFRSPLCHTTAKKCSFKWALVVLEISPIPPKFGQIGIKQGEGRKGRMKKGKG
jgi:hypothetical protein